MMYGLKIKSGTTLSVRFSVYKNDALADADALPTGVLWINGSTAESVVTITGHGEAPEGVYEAQVTVTGPGGATLIEGTPFELIVSGIIGGKAQEATIASGQIVSRFSGEVDGPGETPFQWTLTNGDGDPCRDTHTWISTDNPYSVQNTVGSQVTDDSGSVTYGIDEDVVYYGWADSDDFNFPRPVVQFRHDSTEGLQKWNGTEWEAWV